VFAVVVLVEGQVLAQLVSMGLGVNAQGMYLALDAQRPQRVHALAHAEACRQSHDPMQQIAGTIRPDGPNACTTVHNTVLHRRPTIQVLPAVRLVVVEAVCTLRRVLAADTGDHRAPPLGYLPLREGDVGKLEVEGGEGC
jgi:hypothetical protein